MKKKNIIIVAIIILAVASLVFLLISKKSSNTNNPLSGGTKSLKELIAANIPQKCTYSSTVDSFSSEGTTYISGGKVRGDFTSVSEGKTTASHMITDGNTSYIWTEGQTTGFKMTVSDTEASSAPIAGENGSVSGGDLNQKFDYKCSAWVADSSMFNPPASVTFTDFSNMFGATTSPSNSDTDSTQCSVCNSLSGDDKTQCLSALNCK